MKYIGRVLMFFGSLIFSLSRAGELFGSFLYTRGEYIELEAIRREEDEYHNR